MAKVAVQSAPCTPSANETAKRPLPLFLFPIAVAIVCALIILSGVPAAGGEGNPSRQILGEINLARRAPSGYAAFLREFRGRFTGRFYSLPGSNARVETSEGVKAVDEAIRFLSRQRPLPPLKWSEGLAAAAADLAEEQGDSGSVGHLGRSSGGPEERISRHGRWLRTMGENIYYGPGNARLAVMSLIIDDGVPSRGHRKNIFSNAFGRGGAACGGHPEFGSVCVIDFAGDFKEKEEMR